MISERIYRSDFLELFEAAKKAADAANAKGFLAGKAESSRCVDALDKLRRFPVNPDFLNSSGILERLERVTKSKDCKIKHSASALLQHWKQRIHVYLSNKTHNSSAAITGSTVKKSPFINRLKLPKKCSSSTDQNKKSLPASAPVTKARDDSRGKIRKLIVDALSRVSNEVDEKMREKVEGCSAWRVGIEVESVMFKMMGPFNGKMKNKYRSIMFNLADSKNPDFRRNVLLGLITPPRIVRMKNEEMASTEIQDQVRLCKEKISKREEERIRLLVT